jgi:hypothetical protein
MEELPSISKYPASILLYLAIQFFDVALNSYLYDVKANQLSQDLYFPSIALTSSSMITSLTAAGLDPTYHPKKIKAEQVHASKVSSYCDFASSVANLSKAVKKRHQISEETWISLSDTISAMYSLRYDNQLFISCLLMRALLQLHQKLCSERSVGDEDRWLAKEAFGKALFSCMDAIDIPSITDLEKLVTAAIDEHPGSSVAARETVTDSQLLGQLEDYIMMEEGRLETVGQSSKEKSMKLRLLSGDTMQDLLSYMKS